MTRNFRRILFFTCGIPAIAWSILFLVQLHRESTWNDAVRNNLAPQARHHAEIPTLPAVCGDPTLQVTLGEVCTPYHRIRRLEWLAAATVGGVALLLAAVYWAGRRCRRNRQLLLRHFRNGTRLMTATTLVLVASQALLLACTLYYGPVEFLNTIPSGIILMIALGGVMAVYQVARLLFRFNKEVSLDVDGRFLSQEEAPQLWEFVRETAQTVGTDAPRNIIAGADANFFVTEAKVKAGGVEADGRTLYVSQPLSRILTKLEFRSIIGHEMGHFHGGDTEFSRKFYPVFRNAADTLAAVAGTAESAGSGGYALLPAISLLSFYLESFSETEAEISRERELAADAVGASVASTRDLALGLTKIIQHESAWETAQEQLFNSTTSNRNELPLLSELFLREATRRFAEADRGARIAEMENEKLQHPTDSHPPLGVRLKALGFTVEQLYDDAGQLQPADPGSTLLPGLEQLERELLPQFAPKSDEAERIFNRRQPGFAAMEFFALIWNRSFLVYVAQDGLYGIKFCGAATSNEPQYFAGALELLNDPFFTPGTEVFRTAMGESKVNFFLPYSDIADAQFDGTSRWGMGKIDHCGKLRIRLTNGKKRTFILLGDAYGDGIQRVLLERRDAAGQAPR